jgi:hypothetical protein
MNMVDMVELEAKLVEKLDKMFEKAFEHKEMINDH